ncbi:hypothetical protein [Vibrio vulnificus]|uniref:hypothetical protein n=1 Tax=Vibrio vulnificus TaxID=672 RepID=UPI001A1CEB46|nr:hypothetical protein [Vibrio vulnificus]HDY7583833.1 hypothetical protein [Vibrio vulnificus]
MPNSAIREVNTYPPLIHIAYKHLDAINIVKFTSLIVLIIIEIVLFFSLLAVSQSVEVAITGTVVGVMSTSLFIDLRSYNARIIGVLLFVCLLMAIEYGSTLYISISVPILTFFLVTGSRFGHQMAMLILMPYSLFIGKPVIFIMYFVTVSILYMTNFLNSKNIIKGHAFHLYYYYKNGMEFWNDKEYWQEFNEKKYKTLKSIDIKRILVIFIKEPVSILNVIYLFSLFFFNLNITNLDALLIFGNVIYLFVALFNRLDKFIGDSYRYWEYIAPIFAVVLVSRAGTWPDITGMLIAICISLHLIYTTVCLNRNATKLKLNNRFSNNHELVKFLEGQDDRNILTIPISLSNRLAVETNKRYFYGYTFFGFWFLNKVGVTPFFRRENNIIGKSYVKLIVIDSSQIKQEVITALLEEYKLVQLRKIDSYIIVEKL